MHHYISVSHSWFFLRKKKHLLYLLSCVCFGAVLAMCLSMLVKVRVYKYHPVHMEVRGQLVAVSPLLPPRGPQESNLPAGTSQHS